VAARSASANYNRARSKLRSYLRIE
jgi:hypothetical protein